MSDQSDSRPFPLPWTLHGNDSCYWIEDADGKRLAYIYFVDDRATIGTGSSLKLTPAEALRIARNIAKLPDLLKGRSPDVR